MFELYLLFYVKCPIESCKIVLIVKQLFIYECHKLCIKKIWEYPDHRNEHSIKQALMKYFFIQITQGIVLYKEIEDSIQEIFYQT